MRRAHSSLVSFGILVKGESVSGGLYVPLLWLLVLEAAGELEPKEEIKAIA